MTAVRSWRWSTPPGRKLICKDDHFKVFPLLERLKEGEKLRVLCKKRLQCKCKKELWSLLVFISVKLSNFFLFTWCYASQLSGIVVRLSLLHVRQVQNAKTTVIGVLSHPSSMGWDAWHPLVPHSAASASSFTGEWLQTCSACRKIAKLQGGGGTWVYALHAWERVHKHFIAL